MRPKLIYTKSALPLILEALGLKIDENKNIDWKGTKVHTDDIIGFYKKMLLTKNGPMM